MTSLHDHLCIHTYIHIYTHTHTQLYKALYLSFELLVNKVLYLSFKLVVDVHEEKSGDLDQRDDEGSLSNRSQVIPYQPQDRRQDRGHREPVLVPESLSPH